VFHPKAVHVAEFELAIAGLQVPEMV